MTKEEINVLGFEDLEKRSAEIAEETKEADAEKLGELNEELDNIESRKKVLAIEVEETRKKAEEVANGHGEVIEERKETTMTNEEVRNAKEYIEAYAKYVKTFCQQTYRTGLFLYRTLLPASLQRLSKGLRSLAESEEWKRQETSKSVSSMAHRRQKFTKRVEILSVKRISFLVL